MKKLPRNPGTEWDYFVLHRKPVCSCIHVYNKYVKWFGLPVCEGRALYGADLCTSGVVHLWCQLWGSWDELKCQSWGVTGVWELPQQSFSKSPLRICGLIPFTAWSKPACVYWLWSPFVSASPGDSTWGLYLMKRCLGVRRFEPFNNYLEGWLLLRKSYQFDGFCRGLCL